MPSFPLPLCIGVSPPSPSPPLLPHQLHPRYSVQFLNSAFFCGGREEEKEKGAPHLSNELNPNPIARSQRTSFILPSTFAYNN